MMYKSTRGGETGVTSAQAITRGISGDGGLFVPDSIPRMDLDELNCLKNKSYGGRAEYIFSKYLTDFTQDEIEQCARLAYDTGRFRSPAVAPLKRLDTDLHILELWHGPTCAFKDMALQILPHFMRVSSAKTAGGKTIVILVATSGDTGKAALEGFKDAPNTRILVFYPEDGVSPTQKLQMITQEGGNVAVFGIRGNFDDAQTGVKSIFTDTDMAKRLSANGMMFSSANSINFGRFLPQIVYYVSSYCDLVTRRDIKMGDRINVVVPTGNFGNILAAYYAKKMGLPIKRLICASNRNRVLTDFISTGVYDKNRPFYSTASPSMDILISSNLERLLYHLSGDDCAEISSLMEQLAKEGRYTVSRGLKERVDSIFYAGWCDDMQTAGTIKDVYGRYNYLCDTHTAVAFNVYEQYLENTGDNTPAVIASTANPFKFSSSVLGALGHRVCSDDFANMKKLSEVTGWEIPEPLRSISEKAIRFTDVCNSADMRRVVIGALNIDGGRS